MQLGEAVRNCLDYIAALLVKLFIVMIMAAKQLSDEK